MAISDTITRLQAAKTAIASAITAKGGTVASGDGYEDFATDIGTILGTNEFTNNPQRGDAVYKLPDGTLRFIKLTTLTPSSLPSSWEAVGPVEQPKNSSNQVLISDKTNASCKACAVARFLVTDFKTDGSTNACAVKLHNITMSETFTYTASSISDFATQLDTYLRALSDTTYQWHAYKDTDDKVYIILDNYTAYEGDPGYYTITGCTITKAMYTEVGAFSSLKSKQAAKHSGSPRTSYWQIQNRARTIEFLRTTTSSTYNPATFSYSYPVSLTCWLSSVCDAVRAIYGDGEDGWIDYLDDNFTCDLDAAGTATADEIDSTTGYSKRDGYHNTYALANVTYIDRSGVRQYLYPHIQYCVNCGYNVAGLEAGNWFNQSLYQSMLNDADITYGLSGVTRAAADPVNKCLNLIGGTAVSCTSNRWCSSRCSSSSLWYGGSNGFTNGLSFCNSFSVRRFALYTLNS